MAIVSVAAGDISIQGISDKQVYTDQVSFTVRSDPDFTTTAMLNNQPVDLDTEIEITTPQYYELVVTQTQITGKQVTSQTVRFIVRASERGSTENGLPIWTPYVSVPSSEQAFSDARYEWLMPSAFPMGLEIPVCVRVVDSTLTRLPVNGMIDLAYDKTNSIQLFRGVGSTCLPGIDTPELQIIEVKGPNLQDTKRITIEANTDWQTVSSDIVQDVNFGPHARVHIQNVSDDLLTLSQGCTVTFGPGSVILVDPDITLDIQGHWIAQGTSTDPVVITTADRSQPWGGFLLETAYARIDMDYTIVTASGADTDWFDTHPNSGHSHQSEQGLFYISNRAEVSLDHCALIQNAGQIGHGETGFLTLNHCLIQQSLTTGQYNGGAVTAFDTAFIEFPSATAPFEDDDNDAIYLSGGAHSLTNCLFGWTLDDCIDAGEGAEGSVLVDGCWFESCYHEALALSSGPRHVTIQNSVALNCGQGIECGYGTPYITATNCLLTGNVVGIRFGDNYERTYSGTLDVTHSLSLYNFRDIWTVAWNDWLPRMDQCVIQDNWVTQANDNYPANDLWTNLETNAQADVIRPFTAHEPNTVGMGLALNKTVQDKTRLNKPVPVRLSRFVSYPVFVDYALTTQDRILESGTLTFLPGQTVQTISIQTIPETTAQLTLTDPVKAAITGIAQATYANLEDLQLTLAGPDDTWQYAKGLHKPPLVWPMMDFNDTAWQTGAMPIGYEASSGYQNCLITNLSDMRNQYLSLYARHSFFVDDPNHFTDLLMTVNYDDGYIVYLNGLPIAQKNAPASPTFDQPASGSHEACCTSCNLTPINLTEYLPLLISGKNVIAVQAHNRTLDSSDFLIDINLWTISGKF